MKTCNVLISFDMETEDNADIKGLAEEIKQAAIRYEGYPKNTNVTISLLNTDNSVVEAKDQSVTTIECTCDGMSIATGKDGAISISLEPGEKYKFSITGPFQPSTDPVSMIGSERNARGGLCLERKRFGVMGDICGEREVW